MSTASASAPIDLCVIGGGWAGIAAAVEACDRGLTVALLDAAPQLGGRARTLEIDMGFGPLRLDNGQHLMMGAYRETLALMSRVAPDEFRALHRSPLHLCDTNGLSLRATGAPAPLHLALGLVQSKGLGLTGLFACARLMLALQRCGWRVEAGESVAHLLERAHQPDWLVERLWGPLCASALNTPITEACAQTFAAVLRDTLGGPREASDFVLPKSTLGDCLPLPATDWLTKRGASIRLRTPVRALRLTDEGWRVTAPNAHVLARCIVLAVPPSNSARLLRSASVPGAPLNDADLTERLEAFRPIPIATTYAAWPAHQIQTVPPWVMLTQSSSPPGPSQQSRVTGDWVFDRGVQRGHRILSIVASAVDLADHGDSNSLTRAMAISASHALGLSPPVHATTVLERRATFACVPDRPRFSHPPSGHLPDLWLAGDYTEQDYPATIESAVRSGLRAGTLAANALRQPRTRAQLQAAASA